MRTERTGIEWTLTENGLRVAHDAKGRLLGSIFWSALGWRATKAVVGCTWELFESKKKVEAFVVGEA